MAKKTHGRTDTPEFKVWSSMLFRCLNPRAHNFEDYGGRGIKICDRWAESFQAFLDDMGERPGAGYSIDRIDNDGNYEPGNCRWATRQQQTWNSRKIRHITVNDQTWPIREWARRLDVSEGALRHKMRKLGSVEAAIAHYSTHQVASWPKQPDRIDVDGEALTLKEWATAIGSSERTLRRRAKDLSISLEAAIRMGPSQARGLNVSRALQ